MFLLSLHVQKECLEVLAFFLFLGTFGKPPPGVHTLWSSSETGRLVRTDRRRSLMLQAANEKLSEELAQLRRQVGRGRRQGSRKRRGCGLPANKLQVFRN